MKNKWRSKDEKTDILCIFLWIYERNTKLYHKKSLLNVKKYNTYEADSQQNTVAKKCTEYGNLRREQI